MKDQPTTTFLLTMKDDTLKKVTVPSSWRVTFGPLVPGSKTGYNGHEGLCLRFYAGKEQQKAVFTDVKSFRDTSIPIEERVTTTKQESFRKQGDDKGEILVAEVQVHEWRNPDEPKSEQNADLMRAPAGTLIRLPR